MSDYVRIAKSSITPEMIYDQVLSGIPVYDGARGIPMEMVERALYSAEDRVERELDILISVRKIYCIEDQTFEPPEMNAIVLPPLDLPANWLAGNRQGALKLPKGFPKEVLRFTIRPSRFYANNTRGIEIPVSGPQKAITLERNLLRLRGGYTSPYFAGSNLGVGAFGNGFGAGGTSRVSAGHAVAGGAEIVFTAGLSPRQLLNDWYPILSLIVIGAQIEVLAQVQARMGNGAKREKIQTDAMNNEIEYARGQGNGPLDGEIKMLEKQFDRMVRELNAGQLKFMIIQP